MKIIQNGTRLKDSHRQAVLAIGNFDGVHLGHQAVLRQTEHLAKANGKPFGVVVFEPHPRTFFRPEKPVFRLTPLDVKARLMEKMGLDVLSVLTFDRNLAAMSAHDFIENILVGQHGISHIVCGYDFRFGHKRTGDVALLKQMAEEFGFGVTVIEPVLLHENTHADEPYSSSAIREKLRHGEVRGAANLLGYWWHLRGPVVEGDKRGRELGYPTANIFIDQGGWPKLGIYAVRVKIDDEKRPRPGVGYIGSRPTFHKNGVVLEVHLFDFDADLYGKTLKVELIECLRSDAAFESAEKLIAQMDEDSLKAHRILDDMTAGTDPMSQNWLGAHASAGK
jgi:riboflavin kinase / FMN adenylyltransferase